MERRHRRQRARRAVTFARALPRLAAGAPGGDAPRGRRPPRASTTPSSPTCGQAGTCACSRRTTRCRRCSRELRERGLTLAICSNWDWDLEPAVTETGLDGWFDTVVSSAWAGARKPHPRIYRYLLEQSGLDPDRHPLRRRHVGSRRGGSARRGDDAGLPRTRRALARRDAARRHLTRGGGAGPRPARPAPAVGSRLTTPRGLRQTTRTFWASSPLRPGPTSNSTR